MDTKKIIGIILLVVGLFLGYQGINTVSNNSADVEILGLEIEADNESGKEKGYMYLGLAGVAFIEGVYTLNKKS